jgi:hypothetical protein
MKPSSQRLADIKGRTLPIKWDMSTLFLFAEYAKIETIEQCESTINKALLDLKQAKDTTLKGTPIASVKTVIHMVRASLGGVLSNDELTVLLGEGELDEALTQAVEAYVDNLPEYDAGVTKDAPKAVKKKSCLLCGFMSLPLKWAGSLKIFGVQAWGSFITRVKGITKPQNDNGNKPD